MRSVDANSIGNARVGGWFTKKPETVAVLNTVSANTVVIQHIEILNMTDLG